MALNLNIKKNLTRVAFGLYVLVLIILGAQLFFGDQVMFFANSFTGAPQPHGSAETLTIAYALPSQSLDPTLFDPVTRSRLVNIYEGLVRTDRNLRIQPAIAVSWGLVDPTTWEFKLRPHVKFHNGVEVKTDDVVSSINYALTSDNSQLKALLNSISEVKAVDASTIRITTKTPDPLLLNKLAVTYIFPKDYVNFDQPVGTGPYQFVSWDQGQQMTLKRFENYWGSESYYAQLVLKTIEDKDARIAALSSGLVDLLADVPPSAGCEFTQSNNPGCPTIPNVTMKTIPSLQVNFIMFNPNQGIFQDRTLREAAAYALDRQQFVDIAGGYAHPIDQFVSSGVFGFNPDIKGYDFDMTKAHADADPVVAQSFVQLTVTLDYAQGNDVIAQYIQQQLHGLGINVVLNPLSGNDFQQKILSGSSEMYFLGWRSELGDANDFLQSVVHSRDQSGLSGEFNGTNYANHSVDDLIDKSQEDLNIQTRLKDMQDAMKILVEDDIAGVPLFETQTIFAYKNKIQFDPRVDGYIYASEIK